MFAMRWCMYVLHLMAVACFLQANLLLLPRSYSDAMAPRIWRYSSRYNLRHGAAGGARRGRALEGGVHDAQTWRRGLPHPHPSRVTTKLLQAYRAFRVQAEKARRSHY
uniref:Secreted protein n=1 Tax=Triticum urartu TaxID=4572 RepID=A0A8R7R965_TRIUA